MYGNWVVFKVYLSMELYSRSKLGFNNNFNTSHKLPRASRYSKIFLNGVSVSNGYHNIDWIRALALKYNIAKFLLPIISFNIASIFRKISAEFFLRTRTKVFYNYVCVLYWGKMCYWEELNMRERSQVTISLVSKLSDT